jgi:hypothetical protein
MITGAIAAIVALVQGGGLLLSVLSAIGVSGQAATIITTAAKVAPTAVKAAKVLRPLLQSAMQKIGGDQPLTDDEKQAVAQHRTELFADPLGSMK